MSVDLQNETTGPMIGQTLEAALQHHKNGQLGEAEKNYREILKLEPNHADATHLLGAIALQVGNLQEAERLIDRACTLNPKATNFQINRSQVYLAQGQHFDAAEALWAAGSLENAEAACRAGLAQTPDSNDGLVLLARILGDQGHPREAEDVIYRLLKINPVRLSDNEAGAMSGTASFAQPTSFNYVIDVVGTCNLRCPSCPVGNLSDSSRGRGFMEVKLFEAIVEKISREKPVENTNLWLFNWGEPLLHPEIPRLIEIGRKAGLPVVLSTNLNHKHDFRDAIKAAPSDLIISASGFTQEVYQRTHKRGNIEVVKENMRKLRSYIDEFNSPMTSRVTYHLYRHNLLDANQMAAYANSLGIQFFPVTAFLQPIEKLVQALEGRLEGEDRDVIDLMLDHPVLGKILRREKLSSVNDCSLRTNMMTINHDGSVALCCGVYQSENMLGANFLDLSHKELQGRKYEHEFCKTCFKHGLNSPDVDLGINGDKVNLMTMRINSLAAKANTLAAKTA